MVLSQCFAFLMSDESLTPKVLSNYRGSTLCAGKFAMQRRREFVASACVGRGAVLLVFKDPNKLLNAITSAVTTQDGR